jgi:hypothetical protein
VAPPALSADGLVARERVAAERAGQRRRLALAEVVAGAVLMASTLLGWMNHPRVVRQAHSSMPFAVREVGHTWGLATFPAGALVLALGALAVFWSTRLRRGTRRTGWEALVVSLTAIAVCAVEMTQLLLGRRNWIDRAALAGHPVSSPLVNAAGAGVWVASTASVTLMIVAASYLWRAYGSWVDGPAPAAPSRAPGH